MKVLYRSKKDSKLAGVCSGLGNYFKIDPVIIRMLVILICIFTAILPVLIVYIIAAIIIPLSPANAPLPKYKRLYRSRKFRVLGGVCGGISEYFKLDPTLVRIIFICIFLATAIIPMTIAYILAWFIIPEKTASREIEIE